MGLCIDLCHGDGGECEDDFAGFADGAESRFFEFGDGFIDGCLGSLDVFGDFCYTDLVRYSLMYEGVMAQVEVDSLGGCGYVFFNKRF